MYSVCMSCTLLKCISYYDLSVLSVSVMGGGWGELYLVLFCMFVFFFYFAKPLSPVTLMLSRLPYYYN